MRVALLLTMLLASCASAKPVRWFEADTEMLEAVCEDYTGKLRGCALQRPNVIEIYVLENPNWPPKEARPDAR